MENLNMFLDGDEDDGAMQQPAEGTDMGGGMGAGQDESTGMGGESADGASGDSQAM